MLRILVSKNQHYSCMMCGRCCKRFNVRITTEEVERIKALDWGDEPHPEDFCELIKGFYYFKRKPDGGCVFLDDNDVCRIHRKFGFEVKALTCRGFPMNIISTAPEELSVLARMDCPAVLRNSGKPLKEQQTDIMAIVSEMHFGKGFSAKQRDNLDRAAIDFICQGLHAVVHDRQFPLRQRILWLKSIREQLMKLGPTFINDLDTFKGAWISVLRQAARKIPADPQPLTLLQRTLFRSWLALYCRRDEELLSRSLITRIKNFWGNLAFTTGFGSWKAMGYEHPDISSNHALMFTRTLDDIGDDDTWKPFLDFLVNRIDTLQFFGAAFYDVPFYQGLQALILTFPLVLATAKVHAALDMRTTLVQDDVFKAVLSIDHCHGRSPSLNSQIARYYETFFFDHLTDISLLI